MSAARPPSVQSPPSAKGADAAGDRARLLAELKQRVRRIEGVGGADGTAVVPLGVPSLDAALPGGGLALGAVHEVVGPDADLDSGAATAFCAVLLSRLAAGRGPVFWICRGRDLYAPGLAGFGLQPGSLVLVQAGGVQAGGGRRKVEADILWAMEEALRCRDVGAVVAESGDLDLAMSRRLQLAAEAGGVPGLLLRLGPRRMDASAAVTRWRLQAIPGEMAPPETASSLPGAGGYGPAGPPPAEFHAPAWRAELLRVRGGRPGVWHLVWRHDPLTRLSRLEGGPAPAQPGDLPLGAGKGGLTGEDAVDGGILVRDAAG